MASVNSGNNNQRPPSKLATGWNYARRAFAGVLLVAAVDCVAAEGYYGGEALDSVGYHSAANNYRFAGYMAHGLASFVVAGVSEYGREFDGVAQKHGKPLPRP